MSKEDSSLHFGSFVIAAFLPLIIFSGHKLFGPPQPVVPLGNAVIAAQKEPQVVAGAPLKGVNVKLARYGGAQFAGGMSSMKRTTDAAGKFSFGVLPAGSYLLTISLPKEALAKTAKEKHEMSKSIIQNIKAREAEPSEDLKACLITISDNAGEPITAGWNFETAKAFDPNPSNPKKGKLSLSEDKIDVKSDGKNEMRGTIIKSKSNITNN